MKRAFFALALSLSASFCLFSCGDNAAAKERARIEKEIELARDSVKMYLDSSKVISTAKMPSHVASSKKSAFSFYNDLAKTDSSYAFYLGKVRSFNSRLDSLARKLQELPDK